MDTVQVENCVLSHVNASNAVAFSGTAGALSIRNCVFLGFNYLFNMSGSFPMWFVNNIMYDWNGGPNGGNYPPGSTIAYNALSVPWGTDFAIIASNPFLNYNASNNYEYGVSNLHLVAGSPCINSGDPVQLDFDGSRSDMGIYGGQTPFIDSGAPNYPFVQSLTVPPSVTVGNQLQIQSQGRIGRGY
ncbi:MAG: hypothetical protein IPK53_12225 [bacterium]|nr:hypothetical protein [bacterium]